MHLIFMATARGVGVGVNDVTVVQEGCRWETLMVHQPQEVFAPGRGFVVPNKGCKIIHRSFLHAPGVETSRGEGSELNSNPSVIRGVGHREGTRKCLEKEAQLSVSPC